MDAQTARNHVTPWGAGRRLEFIDFRLHWERTVNRSDLVTFFRISPQQASADLGRYAELAPHNLVYDKRLKTYRATEHFKPISASCGAEPYLNQLKALADGHLSPATSFIGWQPAFDVVQYPSRRIASDTMLRLLWSMHDGDELEISYQSMRDPAPTVRWIAPHALASDGHRWHVRAWCFQSCAFRDFVISRIRDIQESRQGSVRASDDHEWHATVEVIVAPRPGLTDGQKRAIEIDFGMSSGRLTLSCRRALTFYLLRQLQLDQPPSGPPSSQPLELVNRAELEPLILAAQKTAEVISIAPHAASH